MKSLNKAEMFVSRLHKGMTPKHNLKSVLDRFQYFVKGHNKWLNNNWSYNYIHLTLMHHLLVIKA